MLNVLRENFKQTPYLKVILALTAVGLVAYLGNFFLGTGPAVANWAARVNGVEIPYREFQQRANAIDNRYRQLLGDSYSQFRQPERIAQEAIEYLIRDELIVQDARRMGLRASKTEIADTLVSAPQFQDPNTGAFIGVERYKDLVGGETGAAEFEQYLATQILRQRWADLVGQAVSVDEGELGDVFRQRTEKTAIDYVIVPAADQNVDTALDETDLRKWHEEHPEDYRRDESRKIRFVIVERDAVKDTVQVAEADIAAHYENNPEKFRHPDQREARHILFRVEPDASDADREAARKKAEKALERLEAGEDFAELARELSDDTFSASNGGDLGYFAREDMVTPFSDAAFSTEPGAYAPVTESPFGFHVIQVTGRRDEGITPLEDVRDDIRRDLEVQAAQDAVLAEARRVRQLIGEDGARLAEVAQAEGLEVQSRRIEPRETLRDIGASPEFTVTISQMEPGTVSAPLRVAAGMALVTVDEVLPPAVSPFDEVRDEVREHVLADRRMRAAIAAAERALAKADSIEAAANALDVEARESGDLAPGQAVPGAGGSSEAMRERLFGESVQVGDRGVIRVPSGALLFEVTRREPFDPQRFESEKGELRAELLGSRRARYADSVLEQLRRQQNVEINYPILGIN